MSVKIAWDSKAVQAVWRSAARSHVACASRYQNPDATANLVASATYNYNSAGKLTSIDYRDGNANTLNDFSSTCNALGDVATVGNRRSSTREITSRIWNSWSSEEPAGYKADAKLHRYVGNPPE